MTRCSAATCIGQGVWHYPAARHLDKMDGGALRPTLGGAISHLRAVGRGPVIGDGRVALGCIRVDEHFGFPVWPGFSHEHGLRLRRGLSHVKEYVGDDLWIGALGRCQGELTDTLDDRAVVPEAAHDDVRVGIL